ncbi:hypothetical protein PENSPDRAFT_223327 [Peniophora sp. CONT]|nr:hypothetical protein PENSPDRAFT_223327 [Peniophora sp. CONT]
MRLKQLPPHGLQPTIMADPPRLHIPVAQQSFKRSFEEFGFDLDSPQESNVNEASGSGSGNASGSGANGVGNGNSGGSERSKRQRSDDPNASTSDGGSEYMSFENSEASESFVSLPAGTSDRPLAAGPSNLSTVWSPPDLGSHWEDVDMLSTSASTESIPAPGPSTTAAASQPRAVAREDDEPSSLERSIERFNEFDTNISVIRPSRSRPSSPPPVLPPLSLPSAEIEPANEPRADLGAELRRVDEIVQDWHILRDRIRAERQYNPSFSNIDAMRAISRPGSRSARPGSSSGSRAVRFAEDAPSTNESIERLRGGLLSMHERLRMGDREHDDINRRRDASVDTLLRMYAEQVATPPLDSTRPESTSYRPPDTARESTSHRGFNPYIPPWLRRDNPTASTSSARGSGDINPDFARARRDESTGGRRSPRSDFLASLGIGLDSEAESSRPPRLPTPSRERGKPYTTHIRTIH